MTGYYARQGPQVTPAVMAFCAALGLVFGLALAGAVWWESGRHVAPTASMPHEAKIPFEKVPK